MKETELPEGWDLIPLSCVTERVPNIDPTREPARCVRYIDISAIDNHRFKVIPNEVKQFVGKDAPSRARRPVRPGDVLFSNVRTYLRNIALVSDDTGADLCSTGFTVLRPNVAVLPEYLSRWVLSDSFIDCVTPQQTGTHYPATSDRVVLAQVIALPPLAEQRRIVEKVETLLARANAARDCLSRVPSILKRFRQSVLAAACSGRLTEDWREQRPRLQQPFVPSANPRSLTRRRGANLSGDQDLLVDEEMPELPETWTYARIDRLVEAGTVITYGIVLPGPEVPGGVPYVRQQDIEDGHVLVEQLRRTSSAIANRHERSRLQAGDVLLCIIRNLRVAVVPKGIDGANLTQGTVRIRARSDLLLNSYLAAYLTSPHAQGWMKRRYFGMDMPRINVEDARAVPVALPSLEEQREIVYRIRKLFNLADAIEQRVSASINRADKLVQATLAKAFRGELVPTEAELARDEGRDYEPACALLDRLRLRPTERASKGRAGRLSERRFS